MGSYCFRTYFRKLNILWLSFHINKYIPQHHLQLNTDHVTMWPHDYAFTNGISEELNWVITSYWNWLNFSFPFPTNWKVDKELVRELWPHVWDNTLSNKIEGTWVPGQPQAAKLSRTIHVPPDLHKVETHFCKIETHFYLFTNTVLGGLFIIPIQSTP